MESFETDKLMAIIYTSRNLSGSYSGYTNGAWGSLMNTYAVRFTPGAGGQGGGANEGSTFYFSATVNFPWPGIYTVKAAADDSGSLSVAGVGCTVSGFNSEGTTSFYSTAGSKSISGSVYNSFSGPSYATNPYGIAFTINAPDNPPPPTASISINKSSIIAGQDSAVITWSAGGFVSSVTVTSQGSVGTSGSATVSPSSSTTYTITATGSGGTATASVTLTVYQPVVTTITVSPTSIVNGSNATLSWSVSGSASSASIDQGIGAVLFNSSQTISPTSSTTYTLSASGNGGSDSDSATITVYQRPELSVTFPGTYDYGINRQMSVTTRYASSAVTVQLTYLYFGGTTDTATINLTPNESSESGVAVEQGLTPAIPWNNFGPESIDILVTATGLGGTVTRLQTETVNIDRLPDNINIPDRLELAPSTDPVTSPDDDTVLSDPIFIEDIDIPVEIRASQPIQVRFDDDDPDIESNWNSLRQIN